MKKFGLNLNINYDNIKLDKLFEDANKSGAANVSSDKNISSKSYLNTANSYNKSSDNKIETFDFPTNTNTKNNNINLNSNKTPNSNSNINNSNEALNVSNSADSANVSTSNQNVSPNKGDHPEINNNNSSNNLTNSSSSNSIKSNNTVPKSNANITSNPSASVSGSSNSTSNSSSSYGSNKASSSNSQNSNINNNSSKVDAKPSSLNINSSSNQNYANAGGSPSKSVNTSSNFTANNNSTNMDNTSSNVSVDIKNNLNTSPSNNMNVKDGKVVVVSTDSKGNPVNIEIDIEEYTSDLKKFGFNNNDINRIINGQISVQGLIEEIQNDIDPTRKENMMKSSYLQACGLDFANMDELLNAISNISNDLEELKKEKEIEKKVEEIKQIVLVINRLEQGESLEDILKSGNYVAWKYVDSNGNINYVYDDPYASGNYENINYEPLTFKDLYGNSDILKELEGLLSVETINPLFGSSYTVHRWTNDESQIAFLNGLQNNCKNLQNTIYSIDQKIKELSEKKSEYQYVYDYINNEVSYYMKNVDAYTSKDDFSLNNSFNYKSLDKVNAIKESYEKAMPDTYIYIVNDRTELVDILSCMINGEGNISGNYLFNGATAIQLSSSDSMLNNYEKWLSFISDEEKLVFNYIYNTKGTDAAYQYLEGISDELDNRWLANKTKEDQELASNHPFLTSLASIIVTPVEGISAICASINAKIFDTKIRRTDVYSAGDVWRAQVAQDIAKDYGNGWSFVYSTGMSMADSASLIALSVATGGTATPVLSAALMGSRAYVSTLNDALDRGLSDNSAILLAASAAVVETAMESYSLGHLLNLEGKLGANVVNLTNKLASNISNETLSKIVSKGFYISAGALSQGLVEGEEEYATEILNYVCDIFISKDLSNYTSSLNQYLSLGYDESEALGKTMSDFSKQALQAFLGGFVSGCCFGTLGSIKSTINTSDNIATQIYADVYDEKIYNAVYASSDPTTINIPSTSSANLDEDIDLEQNITSNTNQELLELISNTVGDDNKFMNLLNTIDEINHNPDKAKVYGFDNAESFKKNLIRTIIDSGIINKYDNRYINALSKDIVILNELIGTDNLNNLYLKNLLRRPDLFVQDLSRLDISKFNELFDNSTMKEYINSLTSQELATILKEFNSNKANMASWIGNETIINKIINMDIQEFYEFIDILGSSYSKIGNYIKNGNNIDNYVKLLDAIINKFYTTEIIMSDISYKNKIERILPISYGDNEAIEIKLNEINTIKKSVEASIVEKVKSLSDLELDIIESKIFVKCNSDYEYYNLELEINGKKQVINLKPDYKNRIDITSILINNNDYMDTILKGNFKLTNITPDMKKSNLVLTKSKGLKSGINEVTLLLDGKELKLMVNSRYEKIDLNYKLSKELENVQNIQVSSIVYKGNNNITVNDASKLYKISYKIGDNKYDKFIKTDTSIRSVGDNILNIDEFIASNNLVGISDISVTVATNEEIKSKSPNITDYKVANDIFNETTYGGNQSKGYFLLQAYLEGKILSSVNNIKAELLNNLIEKYFKGISDIEKINLIEKISKDSCGYMAVANALATYMGSIPNGNQIFKDKMGFDLTVTDGQIISYNLEAICLDISLEYISKLYNANIKNALNGNNSIGVTLVTFDDIFKTYFENRNINFKYNISNISNSEKYLNNELISKIVNNQDGFNILVADMFDLQLQGDSYESVQSLDGSTKSSKKDGDITKGIGGHAMLVTGIDEDMNIIVSSWNQKYKFLLDSIADYKSNNINSSANIWTIKFDISGN